MKTFFKFLGVCGLFMVAVPGGVIALWYVCYLIVQAAR